MREVPGDPRAIIRAYEWQGGQRYNEMLLRGDGSTEPRHPKPRSVQLTPVTPQGTIHLPWLLSKSTQLPLSIQPSRGLLMPEQLPPVESDLVLPRPGASNLLILPKTRPADPSRP